MRFPKPFFSDLVANYRVDPSSVHTCSITFPNTCAIRITEALVLANHLLPSRAKWSQLPRATGGHGLLLGKYDYKNNLCPHGFGRGARDVADFLREHWGRPTLYWKAQENDEPPAAILGKTGVVSFIKIPGYSGQGHMDVWNGDAAVGHAYWSSASIWFWQLA